MEAILFGALISAIGFGSANIVIKKALSNTSIPQTLISSMVSGSFFLFLLVLLKGLPNNLNLESILILALFAIGEVSLYLSLYKAFEVANVSLASSIIATFPALSTVLTILFFGEKVSIIKIGFIILIVIGGILIGIDWSNIRSQSLSLKTFIKGLPWTLLCLLLHAIYFPALSILTSTGNWEFKLFGIKVFAVIILLILLVIIKKNKFKFTKNRILTGTLLGLLEVIGWIGLSLASSGSSGLIAIMLALSQAPIITPIAGIVLLKEKFVRMQYIGLIIVVIGVTALTLL